jgi:hypothetical protein
MLNSGVSAIPEVAIDAEELAELIEDRLDPAAAQRVENICFQSTVHLAEALSTMRFQGQSQDVDTPSALRQRLLALAPTPQNGHAKGTAGPLPTPSPRVGVVSPATPSNPREANSKAENGSERHSRVFVSHWRTILTTAATLLAVASIGAMVGWLVATRHHARQDERSVVTTPNSVPLPPPPQPSRQQPDQERRPESVVEQSAPPESPLPLPQPVAPQIEASPRSLASEAAVPVERPPQRMVVPPPPPPRVAPVLPPPPELVCQSVQGMMLVDADGTGHWRALQSPIVLDEPTKIVSLAESWSTITIPGFGTLIWEGSVEATLRVRPGNVVEIGLTQGKVGIQGMSEGAQVRFETGGATWTARCLAADATWAVIDDPQTPAMLFVKGVIGIEELSFGPKQIVLWQGGVPALVPPLSEGAGALPASPPALGDPWDLTWLQPPEEALARQWRRLRGQLVNRLAAAEDAKAELKRMLAASRDVRQTALLAQWSLAVADEAGRAEYNWDMLSDRREAVRIAGVKSLLQLPPGDPRQSDVLRRMGEAVDAATRDRVAQWMAAARQPVALPATQAAELADHLQHPELAVRQIAVSLLEMHTAPAFIHARIVPPVYDAASPDVRRAAAQMEWRQILRRLYTAAARNPAGANAPFKPIQPQPGISPNALSPSAAAPPNTAPGSP